MCNNCVAALLYRPLRKQAQIQDELSKDIDLHSANEATHMKSTSGLRKYLDYTLMVDFAFLSFAVSVGLCTTAAISAQILIADQAIVCGVDETRVPLLLAITGIADVTSRIISGLCFDLKLIRPIRKHIFIFTILLNAIVMYCWVIFCAFSYLLCLCILFGALYGVVCAQRAVILADMLGVDKLSSAFSLLTMCSGIGVLIGPLIAGLLRDVTGGYTASFLFMGALQTIAFVLLYTGHFYGKRKINRTLQQENIRKT